MFLGFISTKTNNKHKLLSNSNLPLLFYQPLSFCGKNVSFTHGWNPPLIKMGVGPSKNCVTWGGIKFFAIMGV